MQSITQENEKWMRRALYLARLGEGQVAPNPLVGCVIVHEGKVIGEGYHQKYGEGHAEVNAVNSVADKSLIASSEIYVTLEPCSHYGKTPPCADLLVEHKASKVYICNLDPNPLVAGRGMERLREHGATVHTGILKEEGKWLNRRFFTQMEKQRPYILLKWAQTSDGFVARKNYDSKWISNWLSRKKVHQYRAQEAGILVGTNTAIYDNPRLNVRSWKGSDPVRLILDLHERIPQTHHVFDGEVPTVIYTYGESRISDNGITWQQLNAESDIVTQLLADFQRRKLQSVLVEGGSQLLHSFIEANTWDEAKVFVGQECFGEGIPAPDIKGKCVSRQAVLSNMLETYIPVD